MTWENFTRDEFQCTHCGENEIRDDLIDALQVVRTRCGFPLRVSSGYRCADHPAERRKERPGTHHEGVAADIAVSRGQAHRVLTEALGTGLFSGVGVSQKGDGRFIHLDMAEDSAFRPRPTVWSY